MAKNSPNNGMPIDRPIQLRPGVTYAESACFAQDCGTFERRGFLRDQLDASASVGRANGQRTDFTAKQTKDPTPWSNLR